MTTLLSYDVLQIGVIYLKMPAFFLQSTIQGSALGLLPLPFQISTVLYFVVLVINSFNISGVVLQLKRTLRNILQMMKQKGSDNAISGQGGLWPEKVFCFPSSCLA